ncbi:MAG: tetratricopeptide repeat protein [Bacteroidia bacterium]
MRSLIATSDFDSLYVAHHIELARNFRKYNTDSSQKYYLKGLKYAKELELPSRKMVAFTGLGIIAKNAREFEKGVSYYNQGLTIAKKIGDKKRESGLYNNLGTLHWRWQKLDSALLYFQKSLDLKIELGALSSIAKVYTNMGNLQASRSEIESAKSYYLRALNIYREEGDEKGTANLYFNLGNVYLESGQFDSARIVHAEVLAFSEESNDTTRIIQLLHNLGSASELQEDWDKALEYYERSVKLQGKIDMPLQHILTLNNIGNIYRKKGAYSQAISIYKNALSLSKEIASLDNIQTLNSQLVDCYEKLGQFDSALTYHKAFKKTHDRIEDSRKDSAVNDILIKYNTAQKDKELVEERAENEQKSQENRVLFIVSALLLALLALGWFSYRQKQRANKLLETQKAAIAQSEKEKALLLRELHHRVKNNLQLVSSLLNIQSYQLKDEQAAMAVKESQARVEAMALIHRDLYLTNNDSRVNLEVYISSMLVNLQRSYHVENLVVEEHVEGTEIKADIAIPLGLILNEIISNAFKHAFGEVKQPRLTINVRKETEDSLYVMIKDNGPGPKVDGPRKGSFGLELIRSMSRQIRAKHSTRIESGYIHELRIPLHTT